MTLPTFKHSIVDKAAGFDGWGAAVSADFDGDGRDEIIVREKHGRLLLFHPPSIPTAPWPGQVIANRLPGDGTTVAHLSHPTSADIITNAGLFRNANGDGTRWIREPLIPDDMHWHPESRITVADLDGDGIQEVILTESEIGSARLAILRPAKPAHPWDVEVLIPATDDLRALHSLQIADLDGDGELEIFTAEMENGKTDGILKRPRWWCLKRTMNGGWSRHAILDANLGTHAALVGDFDGDGSADIIGKVWRPNAVNGCDGHNHVDFLRNVTHH